MPLLSLSLTSLLLLSLFHSLSPFVVHVYVCLYIYIYIYIYIYLFMDMSLYLCVCVRLCVCGCHLHAHRHVPCMDTYIHAYIHALYVQQCVDLLFSSVYSYSTNTLCNRKSNEPDQRMLTPAKLSTLQVAVPEGPRL